MEGSLDEAQTGAKNRGPEPEQNSNPESNPGPKPSLRNRRPGLFWTGIAVLAVIVVLITAAEIIAHRAEPMLRARVVETLSTRFNSRVKLKELHVSLLHGLAVSGKGLEVYPNNLDTDTPTFSLDSFSFETSYLNLLRSPMKIGHVDISHLNINLPPKSERKNLPSLGGSGKGGISIVVGEIRATNAKLVMGTDKPDKVPLEFDIKSLVLKSVGADQPMQFTATLVNPKPVGDIKSSGSFGPWNNDNPGDSPVSGDYSFTHADLGTIHGIGGILSSKGKYQGELDRIVVDGETDTPDFEVDVSGNKVPLHTVFHAIVDGTNGDTYLDPVTATVLQSTFTAKGKVVRKKGVPGHLISLDVVMSNARIEDLLRMAVHTTPPVMSGPVKMHTTLVIPPGPQDVAQKIRLMGAFDIQNAHFSDPKVQKRVDELSLRSQGKADKAKDESQGAPKANVSSDMRGKFDLANGLLKIPELHYVVPGANIQLAGIYSLDGNQFDFHGKARLSATVSQIVGGWKGFLLKPVDPFFKKNGAGTVVPIKITGTKSSPNFSLDFGSF